MVELGIFGFDFIKRRVVQITAVKNQGGPKLLTLLQTQAHQFTFIKLNGSKAWPYQLHQAKIAMCEMAIKKTAIIEAIDAKVDVFKLTVFKFRNSKISKGFGSKALVVNVLHDKGTKGFVSKGLYNFCAYV